MTFVSSLRRVVVLAALFVAVATTVSAQAANSGNAPKTVPTSKKVTVSDHELKQFVTTLNDVHVIQVGFQKQFQQAVKASPLSQKRFMQIYQSERSSHKLPANTSPAEKKEYQKLVTSVFGMERTAEQQMVDTVKKDGFTVSRFNTIVRAVHTDPTLASRLKKVK